MIKDNMEFNYYIIINVFYINDKPILHFVNEAMVFQVARFLLNMFVATAWNTLRVMWINTYVGPLNVIQYNTSTNFIAKEFSDNAHIMQIKYHEVLVEAHNLISKVKYYHGLLRRVFEIIESEVRGTGIIKDQILQMAIKMINDMVRPNGLIPTLLVFGIYLQMMEFSPLAPSLAMRVAIVNKVMTKVWRLRVKT